MLQTSSTGKTSFENMSNIWCFLPEKSSEYATGMKTFFKRLVYAFFGSNALYLVDIQPNSKFYPPPTKIFCVRSWRQARRFNFWFLFHQPGCVSHASQHYWEYRTRPEVNQYQRRSEMCSIHYRATH